MADLSLDDLALFVRVVEGGGFAVAARALKVPTSTVSRAIGRIESTAGVRLFQRTTRHVRPTREGEELYATVSPAVGALQGAARSLEPSAKKPKGRLRVTAPSDLATSFLADVIVAFRTKYPQVQLDFTLTNAHSNLVQEGFDVAIRATAQLADSSLVARKLGEIQLRLYAAPAYIEEHGAPRTVDDLERHRCVVFRGKELVRTWTLRGDGGERTVDVRGSIGGDDFTFVRSMVLAGGGIGALPHMNSAADVAAGRLVRVLSEFSLRGASLYVLIPSSKNVPPRVTAFRDFVVDAYAAWIARRDQAERTILAAVR